MEEREIKMGLNAEDVRRRDEGMGLAGLFSSMGDSEADALAIARSEDGMRIAQKMALMRWPEDSDECRAYWAGYEKGLRKEVHGTGAEKWSSFVPLAAERDPERRFPLIFCLHGAHNPIQLAESYGVMQLAAREECVVIAPEDENEAHVEALRAYAVAHLPVDPSRIYLIGYSFGGFMSARIGLSHPEHYAGVGMGGMLFAGDVRGHELDGIWYEPFSLSVEMLRHAEEIGLPALLFMGEREMLRLLPLWREPEGEVRDGVIPLGSRDKQAAFSRWRKIGGCPDTAFLAEGEGKNETERRIGARFERVEIREYAGRKYYLGDSVREDGECLFRTVACGEMVHWPTDAFVPLFWEQIGRYARDPQTGRLIRL